MGGTRGKKGQKAFETTFQKKDIPHNIPVAILKDDCVNITEILTSTKMTSSKSQAKDLFGRVL